MAKRRGNNEGSIYKRPNGTWRAQISLDGKRLSFTGKSQKECQEWIRDTRGQIDNGLTFKGTEINLAGFLEEWLKTVSISRAKSTFDNYRYNVDKRIIPYLGHVKLNDLRSDQIQRLYETLQSEGKSRHAVHCTHKVLRVALNHALKNGLIGRNPCKGTTPPKPKQREMKFFDNGQAKYFFDTAHKLGDRLYPLFHLAIHAGLRLSELMGLKWEDLDLDLRTLQVKRQVLYRTGEGYRFTKPKSSSGRRTIILGKKTLSVLKEHKEILHELRENVGDGWTDLDLMFPSTVGTPLTGSNIRRAFRAILKASKLPKIRFHDLRHTAASLMLNHGIPVLIASRRLGHSKPSITMDVYGHLMPSKQEEAAELLDQLIS